MKKILFLSLYLITGIAFSQKNIPDYVLSKGDKSIIICASATSPNKVTFTLKNIESNELKNKEDETISFEVFPFTEYNFKGAFINALSSIKDDDPNHNIIEIKKENYVGYSQEIKSIFSYFNALITTAFQYDEEPVAGTLKYQSENIIITKNQFLGLSKNNNYFDRQTSLLIEIIKGISGAAKKNNLDSTEIHGLIFEREYINQTELTNANEVVEKYKKDSDEFMDFILDVQNPYLNEFYFEWKYVTNNNIKFKDFKNNVSKKLKEIYNSFQYFKLLEEKWFRKYVCYRYVKYELDQEKSVTETTKANELKAISNLEEKIIKIENNDSFKTFELEKLDIDFNNIVLNEEWLNESKNIVWLNLKINIDNEKIAELDNLIEKSSSDNEKTIYSTKRDLLIQRVNSLEEILEKKNDIDSIVQKHSKILSKIQSIQKQIDKVLIRQVDFVENFHTWKFKMETSQLDINDGFIEHVYVIGNLEIPIYNDIIKQYTLINSNELKKEIKATLPNDFEDIDNFKYTSLGLSNMFDFLFKEPIIKNKIRKLNGKDLKFENQYPFGFSAKTDFNDLYAYTLYHCEGKNEMYSMKLGDFISYEQRHQNDRLDFSPKDQVVTLPDMDPNQLGAVELKKETSSKILGIRSYTDFVGFNEENRNGLVQLEFEKQIPIWTKRKPIYRLLRFFPAPRGSNRGYFNYVKFSFTWSKIENKDKELKTRHSDYYINNELKFDRYVTYMDLVRNQNAAVNMDLNIYSLDFPGAKIRFELNGGVQFGRDLVVDYTEVEKEETSTDETTGQVSTSKKTEKQYQVEKQTNTITYYPDLLIRVRPEERFGGYLRWRPFRMIVPKNDEFYSVSSAEDFVKNGEIEKGWLMRFELSTYYTPSAKSDNKFFFRYRYTNAFDWETNGFAEFQVGYLFYLKL